MLLKDQEGKVISKGEDVSQLEYKKNHRMNMSLYITQYKNAFNFQKQPNLSASVDYEAQSMLVDSVSVDLNNPSINERKLKSSAVNRRHLNMASALESAVGSQNFHGLN